MNIARILRNRLATLDGILSSAQVKVTFYPWIGIDDYAGPLYGTPVTRKAIVEEVQKLRRLSTGQEVMQRAQITIPRPVADNGAANRREPIDPRDKIVLPNGYFGPILEVTGITNPETGNPYMIEIVLG